MSKKRPRSNATEERMAVSLDKLAAYEEFCTEVLPALRGALKEGKSAEDIYKLVEAAAAARTATIALTDPDSARAMTAIKDILDRNKGKAVERRETEHKYGKLSDEELDALLKSEQEELEH